MIPMIQDVPGQTLRLHRPKSFGKMLSTDHAAANAKQKADYEIRREYLGQSSTKCS